MKCAVPRSVHADESGWGVSVNRNGQGHTASPRGRGFVLDYSDRLPGYVTVDSRRGDRPVAPAIAVIRLPGQAPRTLTPTLSQRERANLPPLPLGEGGGEGLARKGRNVAQYLSLVSVDEGDVKHGFVAYVQAVN